MTTLTQTAILTRKVTVIGTIFIVGLVIFLFFLSFGRSVYNRLFPPPPPPGTAQFGKLPPLGLEKISTIQNSAGLKFKLETPTLKLPDLPQLVNVYPIIEPQISLFYALDRAKERVKSLGFEGEPVKIDDFTYQWVDTKLTSRNLVYNFKENSFTLHYNFLTDLDITSKKQIVEDQVPIAKASSFLNAFLKDLGVDSNKFPTKKAQRIAIKNGQLVDAISKQDTDLFRVNFFRADLEKKPVISANPKIAEVSFLVTSLNTAKKDVVDVDFVFWNVDQIHLSPYPARTALEAFEQLKSGKASVLAKPSTPIPNGEIPIRNIYLAYYDPPERPAYFQPVIVFDGDYEFRAIVPAVSDSLIGK